MRKTGRVSSVKTLNRRREVTLAILTALVVPAVLNGQQIQSQQESVKELRTPDQMARVPAVRWIGFRSSRVQADPDVPLNRDSNASQVSIANYETSTQPNIVPSALPTLDLPPLEFATASIQPTLAPLPPNAPLPSIQTGRAPDTEVSNANTGRVTMKVNTKPDTRSGDRKPELVKLPGFKVSESLSLSGESESKGKGVAARLSEFTSSAASTSVPTGVSTRPLNANVVDLSTLLPPPPMPTVERPTVSSHGASVSIVEQPKVGNLAATVAKIRESNPVRHSISNGSILLAAPISGPVSPVAIPQVVQANAQADTNIAVHDQSVTETGSLSLNDLEQVKRAILTAHPNSSFVLKAHPDGGIEIKGKVESEKKAKAVLEMTRKLLLVPIVDKLVVR